MSNKKILFFIPLMAVAALVGCNSNGSGSNNGTNEIIIPEANTNDAVDNRAAVLPDELLVNHRMVSVFVDEEYQLSGLEQLNNRGDNLVFESKNAEIASVDENGVVKGVASGETEIVASIKNHPEVSVTVPVIVNTVISDSQAKSLAEGFEKINEDDLKSIVDYEMYEKRVYKDDKENLDTDGNPVKVLQSYDRYDQRMTVSIDDAYLRIWETDAEIKTEGGAIDFTNYEWIFYTNAFYDTYIFHQTGDVKNYLTVPTQSYMEKARITPIYDILDNLFTSGRKILDNVISSAKLEDFTSLVGSDSSQILAQKSGSNGAGQMLFDCTLSFASETADQDDESRYGIPFGTAMPATQQMRYTVKNNRIIASTITLIQNYDIGDDHYTAYYDIDHKYEDFDEDKSQLFYPDKKNYSRADSIFDV